MGLGLVASDVRAFIKLRVCAACACCVLSLRRLLWQVWLSAAAHLNEFEAQESRFGALGSGLIISRLGTMMQDFPRPPVWALGRGAAVQEAALSTLGERSVGVLT